MAARRLAGPRVDKQTQAGEPAAQAAEPAAQAAEPAAQAAEPAAQAVELAASLAGRRPLAEPRASAVEG